MTDKETLYLYRLKEAEETLYETEKMIKENFSPRSIINRSYYSMFYTILSLFLKTEIMLQRINIAESYQLLTKNLLKQVKLINGIPKFFITLLMTDKKLTIKN